MTATDDTPMNTNEYRDLLDQMGWNQEQAAQALGVTLRTSAGYATGGSIPLTTAKLLRLLAQLPKSRRPQFD